MYIFVGLGGALGSLLRYFLSTTIKSQGDFPLGTFIINVVGSFLIGLIAFYAEKNNLDSTLVLFLKVGFCGGFTTFSTFAFEIFNLGDNQKFGTGIFYAFLSIVLSLFAIYLAREIAIKAF